MTVNEELALTAECFRLYQIAGSARDLAADLNRDAKRSPHHCAELDYIATRLVEIAKECDEYGEKFEKEGEAE